MKHSITHKLAAIATMGAMMSVSPEAYAGTAVTFQTMSRNIIAAAGSFQSLISTVCWIGGAGLGVAGIFKLKNHVDNPGQTAMKDGLIRIGAGGGLLAFPFIQNAMQGSISNGNLQKINAANLQIDSVTAFQ
ncbi:MAG: hypothetical protein ACAH83_12290 [Alphaproteobacteria bacterium]